MKDLRQVSREESATYLRHLIPSTLFSSVFCTVEREQTNHLSTIKTPKILLCAVSRTPEVVVQATQGREVPAQRGAEVRLFGPCKATSGSVVGIFGRDEVEGGVGVVAEGARCAGGGVPLGQRGTGEFGLALAVWEVKGSLTQRKL